MSDVNFRNDKIDTAEALKNNKLAELTDAAKRLTDLEDEISNAELGIKKLKEKANAISQFEIPEIMKELNVAKLKLKDGYSIEVSNFYSASIVDQDAAFQWLRENGRGDVIKNDITVTFGRGEDNKATSYVDLARGSGFEPIQKIGVNPMTLKALVRERLESGQDVPADLFKPFAGNQTKITRR